MKFKDAYRSANDSVHARAELLEEMKYKQAKANVEAPNKREKRRAWWVAVPTTVTAAAVACLAVFVGLRAGRNKSAVPSAPMAADSVVASAEEQTADMTVFKNAGISLKTYDTYDAIAEQLMKRSETRRGWDYGSNGLKSETDVSTAGEPVPAPESMEQPTFTGMLHAANDMDSASDPNRSEYGTNVQVAGVDEADIVKTDGEWLYCLNRLNNKLYVVSANGADSAVSASAKLREMKEDENGYIEYSEMILANERLYVIGTEYDWNDMANEQMTFIDVYELGDRTKLKKVDTLKQEGSYRTARLIGDTLVTVSCKTIWMYDFKNNPEISVWCPSITSEGESQLLEPNDILINEDSRDSGFVLITTVDTATGKQFDSHKAVFGGSNVVYCNKTNLLIASNEWENEKGEEQTDENSKHFVKNISREYTSLCLFEIEAGKIVPIATKKVEGTLLNQFSMDAYNDTYRLVVTRSGYEETIWTDGIDTYEYKQLDDCALYVLDRELEPIGLLENIAENEMVQSVRFMGDVAYFVTFRQVDPLFAVDLSEPTKPTILSALKIPGFSAYLHPFGAGRLLGIGFSADEKTGITDGVKLTLFDVSDPGDVKVIETKKVNASYTTVQYNHKAVFADAASGILAFPADEKYYVYKVSDDGFTEYGAIDMGEMSWDGEARGIAIGENFYVVTTEAVVVLSFDSIEKIAEVNF